MQHETGDFAGFFPILQQMDFMNHAAVAPISFPAAEALGEYARQASQAAYVHAGWYKRAGEVKQAAGRLIGAQGPHEIAFVPNTTTGLALVANGLRWEAGDNVIISNVEYPANRYPWQDLGRFGVEMIEVTQRADGRIAVDDVVGAINERTRVVSLSHVQYASGYRIDLGPIAEAVHRVGGYLCVDAIQSVGVLPVDVQAMGIDFLSADGHKWMLGPEGCGIFYCRGELATKLHPNVVGWMGMVNAQEFGNYQFELLSDARRFEPGSYNMPGILALGASMDLLLEVGIEEIWARVERLTARLCAGLRNKGYRVFSPREVEGERSGIVTFEPGNGSVLPGKIVRDLEQANIIIALREGRLRASPHFYNTAEQIDRLLERLP
jgi:selenocysteine lyase/cysteine desulfurase